jgi:SepF-like predicted cell division protein (DUF552 family)
MLDKIKRVFSSSSSGGSDSDYLEIDLGKEEVQSKVTVKLFALKEYEDVTAVLNDLREGNTVAIIDIKPLRQKDAIELKRAVSKIKKTIEAMEGNIAGFGENMVIATPAFARIHREPVVVKEERKDKYGDLY